MPNNSPNWIEPPPPPPRKGLGCFGKGILAVIALSLLLVMGIYFFASRGLVTSHPTPLPVKDLPPETLAAVRERIVQFQNAAAPTPIPGPSTTQETPAPAPTAAPEGRQLVLTVEEINGLIAANRRARGHASVSISGQTASIQVSIPSNKMPTFPPGYFNGTFTITTDGPTPLTALRVSQIRANGYPLPSSVLSVSYRGNSILGYALSAAAPYNVSTAEIRNGNIILR